MLVVWQFPQEGLVHLWKLRSVIDFLKSGIEGQLSRPIHQLPNGASPGTWTRCLPYQSFYNSTETQK